MWRRLCVDVDPSGRVIGGSVELHRGTDGGTEVIDVLPIGWGAVRTPIEALTDLYWHESGDPPLFPTGPTLDPYGVPVH